MFRTLYIILTLLFTSVLALGQAVDRTFSGTLSDSLQAEPLHGATVRLIQSINNKDQIIQSISTDEAGRFTLKTPPAGLYVLQVHHLGYQTFEERFVVGKEAIPPFSIKLLAASITMDDVEIVATPTVVLKGDTTEFNAGAFSTEPYADADALVKQLPGVEIDADGNVLVQGEQITRIIVDGKEFFSTDPRIALKTLPADVIDKIQFIDEQSRQAQFTGFDDGERNKIINIVTKPDRRSGYFGRMSGAMGNSERYNTGGNISIFRQDERIGINVVTNNVNQSDFSMPDIAEGGGGSSGGGRGRNNSGGGGSGGIPSRANTHSVALNYNNTWLDKIELGGHYVLNSTNSLTLSNSNRETLIGNNSNQIRVSENENDRRNQSHRMGLDIKYKIDSLQELDFTPSFSLQKNNTQVSSFSATQLKNTDPLNASDRNNSNKRDNFTLSGQINYRFRFAKSGRTASIRFDANHNSNAGLAQNYTINQYYEDFLLGRTDTVNNRNNTLSYGNGLTGRASYTEPLGEHIRLEITYNARNRANYSNRETMDYLAETGQFSELNRQLSNEFNNDNLYQAAGMTWMFNKNNWNLSAGMDYQTSFVQNQKVFPTYEHLDHRFQSYLSNARISYRPSRAYNFRFDYRGATNAPSINQLQDVVNNENPLNIRTGNPALLQEYSHRFSFNFNKINRTDGTNLNISLNSDIINNRVVNAIFIADSDTTILPGVILGKGGQFSQPVNMDGYLNNRGNISYGFAIKSLKLNLNLNTGGSHTRSIGMMNNLTTSSDSYRINQRISVNSNISQQLNFSISYGGNYQFVNSANNQNDNHRYFNQTFRNDLTWIFWKGLRFNTSLNYNKNTGITQDYAQEFLVWNLSFGKKMMKNQQAELTFMAYDVMNKGLNISRSVTDMYITDSQTNMLRQYFMLSFTYNIRHFGGGFAGMRGRGSSSNR